jgi:Na+/melibiose symporter-like transporter
LYDWDEYTQGVILSSFFWGYLISHVPGGVLSQQFGGKNVMGTGLLISAILTLIFPWLIQRSRGTIGIVIVARVVMGMGQGVLYPAINAILGQWVPARERAGIASVTYAGAHLGTVFTNVVSGFLISTTKDWASVFYLFGCLGLVWNFLWMLLCYSYPDLHPCMTDKEREFLLEELGEVVSPTSAITSQFFRGTRRFRHEDHTLEGYSHIHAGVEPHRRPMGPRLGVVRREHRPPKVHALGVEIQHCRKRTLVVPSVFDNGVHDHSFRTLFRLAHQQKVSDGHSREKNLFPNR